MTKTIAFLIFPEFQILDVTGPIAAFEIASRIQPDSYRLRVIAEQAGLVNSSSGVALDAKKFLPAHRIDTLIISGGFGSRPAAKSGVTQRLVRACASQSRRVASVCSGTYLLAAAGLLDGKRATTHWGRASDLQQTYPNIRVEADRIFIREKNIWTSAGITAGIDLALALIVEDLGEQIARRVARHMVVYHRRSGGQSQFSTLLEANTEDRFTDLIVYIRANLRKQLTVEHLASKINMSARHFARQFRATKGMTPAKLVESLRAEAAHAALNSGRKSIQAIARDNGFGSTERMRRAFVRRFGQTPAVLKRLV
jgi:transcriptional regulator GlxA family with amidase domain